MMAHLPDEVVRLIALRVFTPAHDMALPKHEVTRHREGGWLAAGSPGRRSSLSAEMRANEGSNRKPLWADNKDALSVRTLVAMAGVSRHWRQLLRGLRLSSEITVNFSASRTSSHSNNLYAAATRLTGISAAVLDSSAIDDALLAVFAAQSSNTLRTLTFIGGLRATSKGNPFSLLQPR
jgi:hypothetical protein